MCFWSLPMCIKLLFAKSVWLLSVGFSWSQYSFYLQRSFACRVTTQHMHILNISDLSNKKCWIDQYLESAFDKLTYTSCHAWICLANFNWESRVTLMNKFFSGLWYDSLISTLRDGKTLKVIVSKSATSFPIRPAASLCQVRKPRWQLIEIQH